MSTLTPVPGLTQHILEHDDRKRITMRIEEWDATIGVRSATVQEVRDAKDAVVNPRTKETDAMLLSVLLVIAATYDPDTNEPIFKRIHRDALMAKHPGVIDRIAGEIVKLSNLGGDALPAAEKNSESTQTS